MKTVFLFSGQGSQYPGMGRELAAAVPEYAENLCAAANEVLGFDLRKKILESSAEELAETTISQPAIMGVSLLAFEAAKKAGYTPEAVAGHSLGEYAAMTAAGMLDIKQAFLAIKYRSEAMARAAAENSGGGMWAVIGLDSGKIEEICAEITGAGHYITPVNYNSPVQTVVAGEKASIDEASSRFMKAGAKRVIPLAVSSAFHSKFMEGAAKEFLEAAKEIKFNEPEIPFYSNVTGGLLTDFSDMPGYLSKHICSPVKFVSQLEAMQKDGFDTFVECGPGKVLTGLVRKTLKDVKAVNIEEEYQKNAE